VTLDDWFTATAATIAALGGPVVDGPGLARERAAVEGLRPGGDRSWGGACRLVPTADGWLAVNLPRDSDRALLPAWLEATSTSDDGWVELVRQRTTAELVERAALLGLAVAAPGTCATRPRRRRPRGAWRDGPARAPKGLRVLDLTSMWAGPLCARLLAEAGAEVITIEDPRRPDGVRLGSPELYRRLHGDRTHRTARLDGAEVAELVRTADVVVESARPRALPQLGIDREAVAATTGCVWIAITGWGLDGGDRAAFGDDAAVAGGLVGPGPTFLGDALADPVTGLVATTLALEALAEGGPWVVDAGLAPCAALVADALA
jgi:hypothetical protein